MDLFDGVTQYQQFFVFWSKQKKNHLHRSIYQAEFSKSKFHKGPLHIHENMALSLVRFYKENMPEGEGATLNPGPHFFVNISEFGVLYFHEFDKDSYETYTQ